MSLERLIIEGFSPGNYENNDYKIQIILGNNRIGKTNLVNYFCYRYIWFSIETIKAEFLYKSLIINIEEKNRSLGYRRTIKR